MEGWGTPVHGNTVIQYQTQLTIHLGLLNCPMWGWNDAKQSGQVQHQVCQNK